MKRFMDDNFLLGNKTAIRLYHDYAKDMPIFDYHCHLNPQEIANDKKYRNITEIWLGGDHYKWRVMRSNGVDERFVTGNATDKEKFLKWAETVPYCICNPIYHWTHLELKRYFGIDKLLSPDTAEEIWERCNKKLQTDDFTARSLITRSNVKVICTTDDPADNLEHHIELAGDKTFKTKVLPTFRPDRSLNIDREGFMDWISRLGDSAGIAINTFEDLKAALLQRLEFFHRVGCKISDHALDSVVFLNSTENEAALIFQKAMKGDSITEDEIKKYKTQVLLYLGRQYARLGWIMQLHMGTIRNNNIKMFKTLGPDTGFDAIGDLPLASTLAGLLNSLDETDELPRTILYCLNPQSNEVLATIIGCFQSGDIPSKIQLGSGWWFNDQKDGMTKQLTVLGNMGLLSRFVGMLTDSRSFLSYTRHEYFRRILCNLLGEWVENGEIPNDIDFVGGIVKDISFNNSKNYFGINI